MYTMSATDVAMRLAAERDTLTVKKAKGRFGAYFTLSDEKGLIAVAVTPSEVAEILKRALA